MSTAPPTVWKLAVSNSPLAKMGHKNDRKASIQHQKRAIQCIGMGYEMMMDNQVTAVKHLQKKTEDDSCLRSRERVLFRTVR